MSSRSTAPAALIALPGTGSDADFVRRAFGPATQRLGIDLIAPDPTDDLVPGHLRALEASAERAHPVLVGGVSLGAAVALAWALGDGGHRCAGVWAALPAWSGPAAGSVAAASARATADALTADGLEPVVEAVTASSPAWLAAELGRSWRALYPGLIRQLQAAADYTAPAVEEITRLAVPLAVTAATDDPLHPEQVAADWAAAAPYGTLESLTLTDWGEDPSRLGDGCLRGWQRLTGR